MAAALPGTTVAATAALVALAVGGHAANSAAAHTAGARRAGSAGGGPVARSSGLFRVRMGPPAQGGSGAAAAVSVSVAALSDVTGEELLAGEFAHHATASVGLMPESSEDPAGG
mmetsp:Transcript_81325/g.225135  ORF Transcript_81325/g.225135 Transcript_81325/m.225135 type:complete len:114 (+) Transcript_81325:54-395(+)